MLKCLASRAWKSVIRLGLGDGFVLRDLGSDPERLDSVGFALRDFRCAALGAQAAGIALTPLAMFLGDTTFVEVILIII